MKMEGFFQVKNNCYQNPRFHQNWAFTLLGRVLKFKADGSYQEFVDMNLILHVIDLPERDGLEKDISDQGTWRIEGKNLVFSKMEKSS